jgi:hypothetical protein
MDQSFFHTEEDEDRNFQWFYFLVVLYLLVTINMEITHVNEETTGDPCKSKF